MGVGDNMLDRNYPIILGRKENGRPTKILYGRKTRENAYDVLILGAKTDRDYPDIPNCSDQEFLESLDGRCYATLHFCNEETLDKTIAFLQKLKENSNK